MPTFVVVRLPETGLLMAEVLRPEVGYVLDDVLEKVHVRDGREVLTSVVRAHGLTEAAFVRLIKTLGDQYMAPEILRQDLLTGDWLFRKHAPRDVLRSQGLVFLLRFMERVAHPWVRYTRGAVEVRAELKPGVNLQEEVAGVKAFFGKSGLAGEIRIEELPPEQMETYAGLRALAGSVL